MPEEAQDATPPFWEKLDAQERKTYHSLTPGERDACMEHVKKLGVGHVKQLLAERHQQQKNTERQAEQAKAANAIEPPSRAPESDQECAYKEDGTRRTARSRESEAAEKRPRRKAATTKARSRTSTNDRKALEEAKTSPAILEAIACALWVRVPYRNGECPQDRIPTEEALNRWISPRPQWSNRVQPLLGLDDVVLPRLRALEAVLPTPLEAGGEWAFTLLWRNEDKAEFRVRYRDPVCLETMCYYPERDEEIAQIFRENRKEEFEAAHNMGYNSFGTRYVNKRGEWLSVVPIGREEEQPPLTEIPERHDELFTIDQLHALWLSLPKHSRPPHPLEPLIVAWQERFRTTEALNIVSPSTMKGPQKTPLSRMPAYVALSSGPVVEAISIDGIPTASLQPPDGHKKVRIHRLDQRMEQGRLFPGPKTINGKAVKDSIITSLNDLSLMKDVRNPMRADAARIAMLAYALDRGVYITEDEGAIFLAGNNSNTSKRRWYEALRLADSIQITINASTGRWYKLVNASPNPESGISKVSAPWWWYEEGQAGGKRTGGFRLSGGLWRSALFVSLTEKKKGTSTGHWGGLHRTLNGLEAALTWGRSAGRGKGGRLPAAVVPVHKGGPGPEWFVPWDWVLLCSGESVPLNASSRGSEARRYRERVSVLEELGYMVVGNKPAPANDTIEIVQRQKGKGKEPGIVIRATARFCAAYAEGQNKNHWQLLPARHLLTTTSS